jgi:hypothetical protein
MADPVTWGILGSAAVGAGSSIYGANQTNKTNQANFNAAQQQQSLINNQAQSMMQQGTNPYAQALMQMISQMRPPEMQGQVQGGPVGIGGGGFGGLRSPIGRGGLYSLGGNTLFSQQGAGVDRGDHILDNADTGISADIGGSTGGMNNGPTYYPPQTINTPVDPGRMQFPQGNMYQYNPVNAPNFKPTMLGAAPMNAINLADLFTPQVGGVPQSQAAQAGPVQQVTGTQGVNAGQDALMQMMNKDIGAPRNDFLGGQLQQLGMGDSQFDNSNLFAAMAPLDQRVIDEQVSQLQGGKGSFGQKFGSQTRKQETDLRSQFAQNITARNAGIQQQSFEAAQGRRMGALGQLGGLEQFYGQMPFQNAALQLQAAQGAGQLGQGSAGLNLQAQLANQQAGLQTGLQNAAFQQQTGQFNAGNSLQAQLAQAQLGLQAGQTNANSQLQLALANQQMGGQYGLANANIANQAGQFNVGNQMAQQQFNTGQGNIYNQLLMNMMGQANQAQMGQQGMNAQLLGIMAGVPTPFQQPSMMPGAVGDAASSAMMLPFLMQMMKQQQGPSTGNYGQGLYPNGMFGG